MPLRLARFASTPRHSIICQEPKGWSSTFGGSPALLWNPGDPSRRNQLWCASGTVWVQYHRHDKHPDCVVEASENLTNPVWLPLQSVTLTNAIYYFSDPGQNAASRFYRIGSQ